MNDGFIILSKNVMQARGFFYWVRFSTFYKPSSVKLELKMVYKKFKILSNEKTILLTVYCIFLKQVENSLYKLTKHFV